MNFTHSITRYNKDEDEIEITVEGEFDPGSAQYFDKSMGNWHPGDPVHFKVLSAKDPDGNTVELTEQEQQEIAEELVDRDRNEDEAYADERYDQMVDDKMTGDYYDREDARWER